MIIWDYSHLFVRFFCFFCVRDVMTIINLVYFYLIPTETFHIALSTKYKFLCINMKYSSSKFWMFVKLALLSIYFMPNFALDIHAGDE